MTNNANWAVRSVETIIFNTRWLLNVFYLGLIFVLVLYGYSYVHEIVHMVLTSYNLSTDLLKIVVLDFVDVVMIANLIIMIISGSYNSFVSKEHGYKNQNISSGMLKIKIATSIVVVAAIHLLKEFVEGNPVWQNIQVQLAIFTAFLITALVLGVLEYMHVKSEEIEHNIEKETHEENSSHH